jgi:pimeloyl-ACP methyl ester carboxylesterase
MDVALESRIDDRFVTVGELKIRYIEQGSGPAAILLHGASLGSCADVWRRNLGPLADYGIRAIAYDQPGFGLSDDPAEWHVGFRTSFILRFMNALGLQRACLVGHSQAGAMAVSLALSHPEHVSRVVVLGTGSLLPPLEGQPRTAPGAAEGDRQAEPTIDETRAELEANVYDRTLIADTDVAIRHRMSTGKNFRAFLARNRAGEKTPGGGSAVPLWQRLVEVTQPLMLIYGREDRAQAGARAKVLAQRFPSLDLHILDNCKHLVQWDAAEAFHRLAGPFLRG